MAHDDGGSGGGSAPSARDEAPLPQRRGGRRRQRQAALGAAAAGGSGAEAGAGAAAAGDGGEEFDGRERRRARLGGVGDMMAGAIACAPPPLGADAAAADVMFDRSVVSVQYEWGSSLMEALEQAGVALYAYMTEIGSVARDPAWSRVIRASGHDLLSLVYAYLTELLVAFAADEFIGADVKITRLDLERFEITAACKGERFSLEKHPQGTEVKAVTYSNMQVNGPSATGQWDVYVIIDI